MTATHAAHAEPIIRWTMGITMVVVGLASFAFPRCFAGVAGYFMRWAKVPADERERFDRVVDAREEAEGISANYGRLLGAIAIALAALETVRAVPFIVPYAVFCLAGATLTMLAYLQFRRAVERRVAPLVRRSPFTAFPPLIIAAVACSFFVALALAAYPPERLGALAVAASTLVLGVIAWRVANAPAMLLGIDPQLEYAVDERVRICRARTVANLACAPVFVTVVLVGPTLPAQYATFGNVATAIVAAAFVVTLAASFIPLRRPIIAA